MAARAGVMETAVVAERTVLLLLRTRYHIVTGQGEAEHLLAEEITTLAFRGAPGAPQWLSEAESEALLEATPTANVGPDRARGMLEDIVASIDRLQDALDEQVEARAAKLLDAHRRVRHAAQARAVAQRVEPQRPPDIVGVYLLLPQVKL